MTARVFHRERIPALLLPFADWWEAHGTFDLVCPEGGGSRTNAMQLADWAKGRAQQADGSWRIVVPDNVVTYAQTAVDSAHGHGGGVDLHPVRTRFANGNPATIYLGDKRLESPEIYAEGMRLFHEVADAGEAFGLESGRGFPHPDFPHFQVPHWRSLPMVDGPVHA